MTADSGRLRTAQAAQACVVCKTRKKKCNKLLPSCGYCIRKHLQCAYIPISRSRHKLAFNTDLLTASDQLSINSISSHTVSSNEVYNEVHSLIRATGQFVDDITARYFQRFHSQLPIISRTRFHERLTGAGADPASDFAILLLAICLVSHAPALGYRPGHDATQSAEQQSLYLRAKSLYAQVQVSYLPSVPLIQAGLLIAVYEYRHGRPGDALVTVTSSVRMGYAAGIHNDDYYRTPTARTTSNESNSQSPLQAEEAANTWWGLTIYERLCLSELRVLDQPLLTILPDGNARLPIEQDVLDQLDVLDTELIPNIALLCWTSTKIAGFGRMAQAICLLEQVLKSFNTQDINLRLLQFDGLDHSIQAFLSLLMPQFRAQPGVAVNCTAINILIRALFLLHSHILTLNPPNFQPKSKHLIQWCKRSQEVLDTVTKVVVDIAKMLVTASSSNTTTPPVDESPSTYPYVAYAALTYLERGLPAMNADWIDSAQDTLQSSLEKYFERWNVSEKWTRFKLAAAKEHVMPELLI